MNQTGDDHVFLIGELAHHLGINPKTIRYYEEIGLLPQPERTESGYRLYSHADRERLRFRMKAKEIGLTLEEIGEIVAMRRERERPCEHVSLLLDRKLEAVDAQLRALAEFRQELVMLREEAANGTRGDARFSWIIEQHEPHRADIPTTSSRE